MTTHLIVVGVDGPEGGRRALQWAAGEAAARGGTVQAVTAWSWDGIKYGPIAAGSPQEERQRAVQMLDREIAGLTARHGSKIPVAAEVVQGRPADALAAASCTAELLVLGSHGHSGVRHTVLGSVSEDCIRKATCPVVVVPVPADPGLARDGRCVRVPDVQIAPTGSCGPPGRDLPPCRPTVGRPDDRREDWRHHAHARHCHDREHRGTGGQLPR